MFSVFDPLTALGILTLAAADPNVCTMPQPTQINVVPRTAEVKLDTSMSKDEIQNHHVDTTNPYGYNVETHTLGYMRGRVQMSQRVKINHQMVMGNRGVCIWYESIDLDISIDPTIVLASELNKDECQFKAVYEHEMKHVMVDRKIVNKYAKSMGQKIYDGLGSRGFIVGPVKADNAQAVVDRMQKTVADILKLESQKLEIERMEKQQEIDSLEEYQRVSNLCK